VRPGLDLDLSHHGVADNTADQAAEPVARRVGDDHPVLPLVSILGQLPGQLSQRHSVHSEPARISGGHFDPARLGPAAQGVIADTKKAGSILDQERRISTRLWKN
jgi:hypothetical protein